MPESSKGEVSIRLLALTLVSMFERFTERARQVVVLAQREARMLKHDHIDGEHILLGLLGEEEGIAAYVLGGLGLNVEKVRCGVVEIVGFGSEVTSGQIPFTPRAKKVLERASREALSLSHRYIGTEHILLALVRENEGIAARILLDGGANSATVRSEVIQALVGGLGTRPMPSLEPIGLSDGLLDGAGAPLRRLVDQFEERLGRPADAGDLLLLLASVPEGISQRSLTALGIDLDSLAQAIDQARSHGGRSALLPPPDVLAECDEVCAERLAAIKAKNYPEAAELRERERDLLASALRPVEQRQKKFLDELWGRLEHRRR